MSTHLLTETSIVARVESALRRLAQQDRYLLTLEGSECAIAHKLAVYVEMFFPRSWHVDCEFSREGESLKQITLDNQLRAVRPDIIVHRRGPRGPNLLAVELKRCGNARDWAHDVGKLRRYRVEKSYKMGLFLYLPVGGFSPVLCWV
jgi:hypothetical protein